MRSKPKVMLVGTFPDLFLEGLKELDFDFFLHKGNTPNTKRNVDIAIMGADRTSETFDYVSKLKAVPIVIAGTDYFVDFDPVSESGNAFLYEENSPWSLLAALIRASETYKFTYDWKVLEGQVKDLLIECSNAGLATARS